MSERVELSVLKGLGVNTVFKVSERGCLSSGDQRAVSECGWMHTVKECEDVD